MHSRQYTIHSTQYTVQSTFSLRVGKVIPDLDQIHVYSTQHMAQYTVQDTEETVHFTFTLGGGQVIPCLDQVHRAQYKVRSTQYIIFFATRHIVHLRLFAVHHCDTVNFFAVTEWCSVQGLLGVCRGEERHLGTKNLSNFTFLHFVFKKTDGTSLALLTSIHFRKIHFKMAPVVSFCFLLAHVLSCLVLHSLQSKKK